MAQTTWTDHIFICKKFIHHIYPLLVYSYCNNNIKKSYVLVTWQTRISSYSCNALKICLNNSSLWWTLLIRPGSQPPLSQIWNLRAGTLGISCRSSSLVPPSRVLLFRLDFFVCRAGMTACSSAAQRGVGRASTCCRGCRSTWGLTMARSPSSAKRRTVARNSPRLET